MSSNDVLKKIQKMLALANRAGTTGEAEAAMAQVHKMLIKYNLSMEDVSRYSVKKYNKKFLPPAKVGRWQQDVMASIGQLYLVKVFSGHDKGMVTMIFVGKDHNIEVAMGVCDMVVKAAKKASKAHIQLLRQAGFYNKHSRKSFYRGYAVQIGMRALAIIKEATTPTPGTTGTALVVQNMYIQEPEDILEFMKQDHRVQDDKPKKVDMRKIDPVSLQCGIQAANDINLKPGSNHA